MEFSYTKGVEVLKRGSSSLLDFLVFSSLKSHLAGSKLLRFLCTIAKDGFSLIYLKKGSLNKWIEKEGSYVEK